MFSSWRARCFPQQEAGTQTELKGEPVFGFQLKMSHSPKVRILSCFSYYRPLFLCIKCCSTVMCLLPLHWVTPQSPVLPCWSSLSTRRCAKALIKIRATVVGACYLSFYSHVNYVIKLHFFQVEACVGVINFISHYCQELGAKCSLCSF